MFVPGMSLMGIVPAGIIEPFLLAQAGARKAPPKGEPSFLVPSLYLIAALLLAAIVIALVNRWTRRRPSESASPNDQLTHFRSLYEKGEISQEEFSKLRTLLGGKIRERVPEAPPGAAPAPTDERTRTDTAPEPSATPHNPPGPSQPPETGIRPG